MAKGIRTPVCRSQCGHLNHLDNEAVTVLYTTADVISAVAVWFMPDTLFRRYSFVYVLYFIPPLFFSLCHTLCRRYSFVYVLYFIPLLLFGLCLKRYSAVAVWFMPDTLFRCCCLVYARYFILMLLFGLCLILYSAVAVWFMPVLCTTILLLLFNLCLILLTILCCCLVYVFTLIYQSAVEAWFMHGALHYHRCYSCSLCLVYVFYCTLPPMLQLLFMSGLCILLYTTTDVTAAFYVWFMYFTVHYHRCYSCSLCLVYVFYKYTTTGVIAAFYVWFMYSTYTTTGVTAAFYVWFLYSTVHYHRCYSCVLCPAFYVSFMHSTLHYHSAIAVC